MCTCIPSLSSGLDTNSFGAQQSPLTLEAWRACANISATQGYDILKKPLALQTQAIPGNVPAHSLDIMMGICPIVDMTACPMSASPMHIVGHV